jgi:hypothetical protein
VRDSADSCLDVGLLFERKVLYELLRHTERTQADHQDDAVHVLVAPRHCVRRHRAFRVRERTGLRADPDAERLRSRSLRNLLPGLRKR